MVTNSVLKKPLETLGLGRKRQMGLFSVNMEDKSQSFSSCNITEKNGDLSFERESSEQFVELNRCHRDIETQLARSRASLSMIPIWSQMASI